jgi:tight adherence protein C
MAIVFSFISVFILSLLLIVPAAEKRQVSKSLEYLAAYESMPVPVAEQTDGLEVPAVPFAERVTQPFFSWLINLAKKITPVGMVNGIRQQLVLAGNPRELNVDKFVALKAIFSLATLIILVLLALIPSVSRSKLITIGMFAVPAAFFLPDLWLRQVVEKRQKAIRLALPDTLDLLTISVEAGLGFDSALTKVIKNSRGPLAEEFSKMLSEMQVGMSRKDAFRNLTRRTTVEELRTFVTAMIQADVFGISISKVLRTQAKEMRVKRTQKAEEIAQKAPVKIVFPLILCILPAIFVVILGPAAIRIYSALFAVLNR